MPAYDGSAYSPPAPVAHVIVTDPATSQSVSDVPMLVDTGADVTLLPLLAIQSFVPDSLSLPTYELEGFEGTRTLAKVVQLEIQLFGKSFRGQYLLVDGSHGILGRNILNRLSLHFDGPKLTWLEVTS